MPNRSPVHRFLALGVLFSPLAAFAFQASSATPAEFSLSPDVAQKLGTAQSAIKAHNWRKAGASLEQAERLELNALERYRVDELKAYVLYQESHLDKAAKAYAALLKAPYSTPQQRRRRSKFVAEMYFRAADYQHAADYSRRYLGRYATDIPMAEVLADSELRLKDYRQSALAMQKVIEQSEKHGKVPHESWLRIAANAHYGLADEPGEDRMLEKLVHYYDRPEDWRALLSLRVHHTKDAHLAYAYMRLAFDLHVLEGPEDYENLVLESLRRGLPQTAQIVLARAKQRRVFADDRYQRLANMVADKSASEPAAAARGAVHDADQGQLYLSEGKNGAASQALLAALKEGGLPHPDETRVNLGIAYLRDRNVEAAQQIFKAVPIASPWHPVAQLWEIRADAQRPEALS